MPRDPQIFVYVGIKNSVVALDDRTGAELWRTQLRGSDFVTVLWDGESLFAANSGEVWRLEPLSGSVMWHNQLKGLGRGVVSLASSRRPASASSGAIDSAVAKRRLDEQAAAVVAAS
jgi:outer membrane protein assembly factor BamB